MDKLTIADIRATRRFSKAVGVDMPSEIAIDILLERIEVLEATLASVKEFMEQQQLTIGAGLAGTYMLVCAALSFQDGV